MRTALATVLLWAIAPLSAQTPVPVPSDARQVHWERSLDDALAVCRATGKPLLLSVNMDGESASDRIVHEEYVDPEFVALTRHCVCLGASVFRHNARDHDDEGRRIECPRFGGITCGEHMALEPVLFEKYLADGERVAPRHALVLADGKKAFDLSLCFDLRDIDHALAAVVLAGGLNPGITKHQVLPTPVEAPPANDWDALAARRDAAGRSELEAAIARLRAHDIGSLAAAMAAIEAHGDRGSLDALRLVAARLDTLPTGIADGAFGRAVHGVDATSLLREAAQRLVAAGDPRLSAKALAAIRWLGLGRLAKDLTDTDVTYVCAAVATGSSDGYVLGTHYRFDQMINGLSKPLREHGGPVSIAELFALAATPAGKVEDNAATDDMPEAAALETTLEELDRTPKDQRNDAEWSARFAKTSLDLARRRIESGGKDAQLLLEDAEQFFGRALQKQPDRYEWWIERARTSYFRQAFEAEAEHGRHAFALAIGGDAPPLERDAAILTVLRNARAVEALRWIADAEARLLAAMPPRPHAPRLGSMIDALRAFGLAAASPFATDKDWLSFASFTAALDLLPQAEAIAQFGAMRFPASRDLRQELNTALQRCGRPDLAASVAEAIARANPPSADISWHTGYAWILVAEDHRRRERPLAAVAAYDRAAQEFARAATQNEAYRDNCTWMQAGCALGNAMAQLQSGDRSRASELLVDAVSLRADLSAWKDGLGMDVLDVIDRALEWRITGPSPVDPMPLLAAIDKHAASSSFYAAAISDALLREALRADGRNPVRRDRRTVDAGGKPIVMPMGLPNEEGDRYLLASIEIGRIAAARAPTADDKVPLAQSLTIWAERGFERGDEKGVREALVEAAPLVGETPPDASADAAALRALTERLRGKLGEARPRWRDGR